MTLLKKAFNHKGHKEKYVSSQKVGGGGFAGGEAARKTPIFSPLY